MKSWFTSIYMPVLNFLNDFRSTEAKSFAEKFVLINYRLLLKEKESLPFVDLLNSPWSLGRVESDKPT